MLQGTLHIEYAAERERYTAGLAALGHTGYTSYQRTSLGAEFTLTQTAERCSLHITGAALGEKPRLPPSAYPAPNPKTFLKHPKPKCEVSEKHR